MNRYTKHIGAGLLGLALFTAQSRALPLVPGGFLPITPVEADPAAGSALVDFTVGPYAGATIVGFVESYVFLDPGNALGGLTFVYHVVETAGSSGVVSIGIDDFAGFLTDASQTPGGPGTALPLLVGASPASFVERSITGDTVTFHFTPPPAGALFPGEHSFFLVVETDATSYKMDTAGLADGSGATAFPIFAPAAPDGGLTIGLLGLGLAGIGALRRKLKV